MLKRMKEAVAAVVVLAIGGCATLQQGGGALRAVETLGPPLAASISETECRALSCQDPAAGRALQRSLAGVDPAVHACLAGVTKALSGECPKE